MDPRLPDLSSMPFFRGGMRLSLEPSIGVPRLFGSLIGLGLLGAVLAVGWTPLMDGLDAVGWKLLWLVPLHFLADALDSVGWRALLRSSPCRPGALYFAWAAAMRNAAGALLPVVGAAAPLIGVGLIAARGVRGYLAFASVIVECSVSLISQALFVLGASALCATLPGAARLLWLTWPPALVTLALGMLFVLLQRRRVLYRAVAALAMRWWPRVRRQGRSTPIRLYAALRAIHRCRGVLTVCMLWQMAALAVGALELWLVLALLHRPVGIMVPLLLQAAVRMSRSLTFTVPAGLGVQEGVFAAVAAASGIPVSIGLSLSLMARCRDVLFGMPLLALWWLRRTAARSAPQEPMFAETAAVERVQG